jgi:hypothetical protein
MQALRLAAYFESFKKSLSLNDPQTAVPNAPGRKLRQDDNLHNEIFGGVGT